MRIFISLLAVFQIVFLNQAHSFENPAIDRDILNPNLSDDYREELRQIKEVCESASENLFDVNVPLNHFNLAENKKTARLYYEHIKLNDGPTIILLPGGPGQGSIGSSTVGDFNTINTAPRSTQCNYGVEQDFPSHLVTTMQAAMDVVAIVRKEKLNNYFLMGVSYGTVMSQHVAYLLERSGLPNPKGILNISTVAKAFSSPRSEDSNYHKQWDLLLKKYPHLLALFNSTHLPLGLSADFWADFLKYYPTFFWSLAGQRLNRLYKHLVVDPGSDKEIENWFLRRASFFQPDPHGATTDYHYYLSVGCTELWKNNQWLSHKPALVNGRLVTVPRDPMGPDLCDGRDFSNPYNSDHFQISTPILYIHGENDGAAPLKSARRGFFHQKKSRVKKFIVVREAGHAVVNYDLSGCFNQILGQFVSGNWNFKKILNSEGRCIDSKNESAESLINDVI